MLGLLVKACHGFEKPNIIRESCGQHGGITLLFTAVPEHGIRGKHPFISGLYPLFIPGKKPEFGCKLKK